jgi:hypothetical protein
MALSGRNPGLAMGVLGSSEGMASASQDACRYRREYRYGLARIQFKMMGQLGCFEETIARVCWSCFHQTTVSGPLKQLRTCPITSQIHPNLKLTLIDMAFKAPSKAWQGAI